MPSSAISFSKSMCSQTPHAVKPAHLYALVCATDGHARKGRHSLFRSAHGQELNEAAMAGKAVVIVVLEWEVVVAAVARYPTTAANLAGQFSS